MSPMLRLVFILIFSVVPIVPGLAQTDPHAGDVDLFGDQTSAAYVFVQMAQSGTLDEDAQACSTSACKGSPTIPA